MFPTILYIYTIYTIFKKKSYKKIDGNIYLFFIVLIYCFKIKKIIIDEHIFIDKCYRLKTHKLDGNVYFFIALKWKKK